MDFFEAQERARRVTAKLVILYCLAVALLIATVYVIALVLFGFADDIATGRPGLWHPELFLTVSSLLIIVILAGTFFRIAQLRRGGAAVAEMLGGRKIDSSTTDPHEKRLLNIVEEMSIASGLPVPEIYILDAEERINAFAAGFGTTDAAVGVTRGALLTLNRDELQGVIAHEFSHIFNGDMRLNIRLIGILNGILLLHLMGLILMRSAALSNATRGGSRGGQGGGNATVALMLFGLALIIIGYIGMLFGRIIQAAISRQREYLADAAAVQYTRNPDGISGALEKIARSSEQGKIRDGHAMELSHLFFANSFHSALDRLFATHPPIADRIRAIGALPLEMRSAKRPEPEEPVTPRAQSSREGEIDSEFGEWATLLIASSGTLTPERLNHASTLLESLPESLREAAHEPYTAEALIYALPLSLQGDQSEQMPGWFSSETGPDMAKQVAAFVQTLKEKREWLLPLAEIALPALRSMSESQYREFRDNLVRLADISGADRLLSYLLQKMVIVQLDRHIVSRETEEVRHHHFRSLTGELAILLSAFAHAGSADPRDAWNRGLDPIRMHLTEEIPFLERSEYTVEELDRALDEVGALANPGKKRLLSVAVQIITADGTVSVEEQELLRVFAEVLGTPVPVGVFGIDSLPKR